MNQLDLLAKMKMEKIPNTNKNSTLVNLNVVV